MPNQHQSHYLKPQNRWLQAISRARTQQASTLQYDPRSPAPGPQPDYSITMPLDLPGPVIAHPPVLEDTIVNPVPRIKPEYPVLKDKRTEEERAQDLLHPELKVEHL